MNAPRLRVLLSYWYARTMDRAALVEQLHDVDLILDSGAFSAHTSGARITVDEYAAWLRSWAGRATAAFSLDVIGDPVASLTNYRALVAADTGVPVVPVFHAGSAARHLDDLVDTGCTYLAFGGLVEHFRNRKKVERWAAWHLRRCVQAGVAVHALGAAGATARDLPFYSADSSTWTMAPRLGFVCAWNSRSRLVNQVQIRNPERLAHYAPVLRASGYDVARLARPGFLRGEGSREGGDDRTYVFEQGARAFLRMGDDLSRRRTVPAPPGLAPHTDAGPKLYLAATAPREVRYLKAAWAAHNTERMPA